MSMRGSLEISKVLSSEPHGPRARCDVLEPLEPKWHMARRSYEMICALFQASLVLYHKSLQLLLRVPVDGNQPITSTQRPLSALGCAAASPNVEPRPRLPHCHIDEAWWRGDRCIPIAQASFALTPVLVCGGDCPPLVNPCFVTLDCYCEG